MVEAGRFCVFGDWDETPTPAGKLRIVMPPLSHVYGGGWQATTQAALNALLDFVTPGCSFLDIGTGSGILCVAAKLLGAGPCTATDINQDALEAARRTFAANGVEVELVDGTFLPEKRFDLAVISISSDFAREHLGRINATTILAVEDDARVVMHYA